jgi:hypothetical protein
MATGHANDHLRQGAAVLARIKEAGAPASLKALATAFGREQNKLQAAERAVEDAHAARDAALENVGAADAVLDRSLDVLADSLVGAGLAPRANAFRGFSKYAPAAMKKLAYAFEVRAVQKLVAAVARSSPPKTVKKAAAASGNAAAQANRALRALAKPQALYSTALADRDALLPEWKRAYERLRVNAQAAWIDTPAVYKAVFAPPDAVAGTTKPRRAKRRAKAKAAAPKAAPMKPAAPTPTNGAAQANGAGTPSVE